jgi:peptidoglycan/LPS O-acetylase OafA/YrhL
MERSRVGQADHIASQDQGHKQYSALDGIRGTAIILVFMDHFGGGAKSPNRVLHMIGLIVQSGWA